MFSLFNPWLIIGAICALIGIYGYGHHSGYQERVEEDKAEIERLNGLARAKEFELKSKVSKAQNELKRTINALNTTKNSAYADVDAGKLRLPSSCGVQTDTGSSSGTATNGADTERKTIKALIDIATEGDTAITSLNACIAQYNEVMKTVNEGVK